MQTCYSTHFWTDFLGIELDDIIFLKVVPNCDSKCYSWSVLFYTSANGPLGAAHMQHSSRKDQYERVRKISKANTYRWRQYIFRLSRPFPPPNWAFRESHGYTPVWLTVREFLLFSPSSREIAKNVKKETSVIENRKHLSKHNYISNAQNVTSLCQVYS